jgi:hypothetical protein
MKKDSLGKMLSKGTTKWYCSSILNIMHFISDFVHCYYRSYSFVQLVHNYISYQLTDPRLINEKKSLELLEKERLLCFEHLGILGAKGSNTILVFKPNTHINYSNPCPICSYYDEHGNRKSNQELGDNYI